MKEQIDKIEREVNKISEALIGNEYNKDGLINRVERIENKSKCNDKKIKDLKVKAGLFGAAFGGGVIGLKELIHKIFGY